MYYLIINKADLVTTDTEGNQVDLTPETARQSVDGTQVIIDDVQFDQLGIEEIDCQMVSWKKGLSLMETPEWKVEE